ncbi:Thioredoxin [Penicillium cf. griseofulvum]|uniref:Thioredoxin n=1 Tax=Penicillium cf. griseofulvum TaxID=2972120 RepID=A0A9W9J144_9EURO|nr:Thioredoxin [Penicillium cf. griseofulvum]KAJ5423041.1 Thioredoxin [Penicillium cf. griseofulvum]KAJ5433741.1 Thioredoxin [Penicillium cf. griseofulvum]
MPIIEITSKADFLEKILGSKDAAILDCYAKWSPSCRSIAPQFEELSNTYTQVKFYKVDVDNVEEVALELGVRTAPTCMLFKDGEKITEIVGAHLSVIEQGIKSHLL